MADPELVRVLDYILNRSDEATIEAVAAAVVRRKRDLSLFGAREGLDPGRWAKKAAQEAAGGMSLSSVRATVRDLAAGMLRKEAPELDEAQIDELLSSWIPDPRSSSGPALPADAILAMADQFVAYSAGRMDAREDAALRAELGDWPRAYWAALPPYVRALVKDYLEGGLAEGDYRAKLLAAAELAAGE